MIQKARTLKEIRQQRLDRSKPLDVKLTVRFHFGDQPEDSATMLDDQSVPLVGSVFENRDRIMRAFVVLLIKAGIRQPKIFSDSLPLMKLLKSSK